MMFALRKMSRLMKTGAVAQNVHQEPAGWRLLAFAFAFCRKLVLRTFLCDGTCKPLLTSKPSLTIVLKISKTIEKPSKPMVGPSKNIQWWWSNGIKTIEKPLKSMVAWKKTLTIPSLWKIDHRCGLYKEHFPTLCDDRQCCAMQIEVRQKYDFTKIGKYECGDQDKYWCKSWLPFSTSPTGEGRGGDGCSLPATHQIDRWAFPNIAGTSWGHLRDHLRAFRNFPLQGEQR